MLQKRAIPKADQLARTIRAWVRDGAWAAGDRLPSERALAQRFGVNTRTVRQGLARLEQRGVIEKRPRVGHFVAEEARGSPVTRLAVALPSYMQNMRTMRGAIHRSAEQTLPAASAGPHPYTGNFLVGVANAVEHRRYAVNTFFYDLETFERDVHELAVSAGIRGLALQSMQALPRSAVERLCEAGIEVVLVGAGPGQFRGLGLVSVGVDAVAPLYESVSHLRALGHERIACVHYERSPVRLGLDEALAEAMAPIESEWAQRHARIEVPNPPHDVDLSAIQRLFEAGATAVIAQDEFLTWEVLRLCDQGGVAVPRDLSVVAICNNTPGLFRQPLSAPDSERLNTRLAALAMQHLTKRVEGKAAEAQNVTLESPIQWTESVAPPGVEPTAAGDALHARG